MLKHFYSNSKLLLTTALLASAWGGNVFADTDLYNNLTSNGEAFGKEFNINWDKQKFEATMDISGWVKSADDGTNVELLALGDNITASDKQLHIYCEKAATGGVNIYVILNHDNNAPCSSSDNHKFRYTYSPKSYDDIKVVISKTDGLTINENPPAYSFGTNDYYLSSHLNFFFNNSALTVGTTNTELTYVKLSGTSSRNVDVQLNYSKDVTYNSIKVVDLPANPSSISNTLASDEVANTYFEGRQCERNDNDKFSETANIDWATQKIVAKFDVSNCSKRSSNPDNLLSVGESISGWADGHAHMHFYYNKEHSGTSTGTGTRTGTGTSTPSGTLTYWYIDKSKTCILNNKTITITGNEVTIEISKENGLVINGTSCNNGNTNYETLYADLWALSTVEIGSTQGDGRSDALINYVNVVTKAGSTTSSNTLHESNSNTFTSQNNVTVALDRTFADDGWYTLCVPFGVDAEMLKSVFGDGVELRTFGSMSGTTMNFVKSEEIEAGVPYLLKVSQTVENPTFDGVNLVAPTSDMPEAKGEDGYYMQGVYGVTEIKTDGTNLFLGGNNKFYKPTENGNRLKGMRVYFVVPEGTSTTALVANIDGTLTAIDSLEGAAVVEDTTIYNLNGVAVGKDVTRLQRGIYVRGGKKFIVR